MSDLSNPLLRAAEDKLEAGLTPENKSDYDKVVIAGMHAALDRGPNGILASLKLSKDPVSDAAKGAVAMVIILRKQARGVMPLKAMIPAGMTLMFKALDFADRSKIVQVREPELVRAAHIFTDHVFAALGVTKQRLASVTQRVHQITNDPAIMRKIGEKAGTVVSPGAAVHPGPAGMINQPPPAPNA